MVALLSGTGMSTRDIAPVVGVNQATVVRDVQARDANASPGESAPAQITGHDGKTYTRPTSLAPPWSCTTTAQSQGGGVLADAGKNPRPT